MVVTCATGQRVVTELLAKGYQVRATDIKGERRPPSAREAEAQGLGSIIVAWGVRIGSRVILCVSACLIEST